MKVRVASYNTALSRTSSDELLAALKSTFVAKDKSDTDKQVLATVALLQEIRADIILLNEVDFDASGEIAETLINLLRQPKDGRAELDYPFLFCQPVNTGMPSGRDFDKNGIASDKGADALGFGDFPGQYGMLLLSRFPIDHFSSRTFQHLLWRDMPNANLPKHSSGEPWFDDEDLAVLPLSSKSHWDVIVKVAGESLHCLCSHPTPPAFDGPEGRNVCRNQDELRFWTDYLSQAPYFVDDQRRRGGFSGSDFVLLGDLNASPFEGDASRETIQNLLTHPLMAELEFPKSKGGIVHSPKVNKAHSVSHTAVWRMQADYVRPSKSLNVIEQAVFWPDSNNHQFSLLKNTSDHRLVYLDLDFTKTL